jgi:acetyl-CoA carboxylase biotin carboxyl carrier protein
LDLNDIREILQLLEEKEISEFELEREGIKLRIKKGPAASNHSAPFPVAEAPATVFPAPPPPAVPAASPAPEAPPAELEDGMTVVRSPIVGTFYRSPDPNSPPFVSEGDRVSVGQVLCIIEAMKLMNEIEAEAAGQIVRIYRESGQPVQYGEPLFDLRPDR